MNSNRLFRRKVNIRLSQNLQLSDSAYWRFSKTLSGQEFRKRCSAWIGSSAFVKR